MGGVFRRSQSDSCLLVFSHFLIINKKKTLTLHIFTPGSFFLLLFSSPPPLPLHRPDNSPQSVHLSVCLSSLGRRLVTCHCLPSALDALEPSVETRQRDPRPHHNVRGGSSLQISC